MNQSPASRSETPIGWTLLNDRLRDTWTVSLLARALGVSSRTLHRVFLEEYGLPPMSMLRRVRLEAARRQLESGEPGTTVTRTALDCGFTHLGRFSREYARRFGERPSETLLRVHRAPLPAEPRRLWPSMELRHA